MIETIVTKQQLAEALQCSTKHIERQVKAGLPFIPFGSRAVRFSLESVLKWLKSRESCLSAKTPKAAGTLKSDFPVSEGKTCDRLMCDDHAHEIGPELHYCEAHYQMWIAFKESGGVDASLKNVIAFKPEK